MISKSLFGKSFALFTIVLAMSLGATTARAQTSSFTYQGRLTDGGAAANGNYDLQFALFDSLSGGAQVGSTQTLNTVAVSNGVFTVGLDFGANAFNGANRFLEISARPSGGGAFTLLSPRQQCGALRRPAQIRRRMRPTRHNLAAWPLINLCGPTTLACLIPDPRPLAPRITFKTQVRLRPVVAST